MALVGFLAIVVLVMGGQTWRTAGWALVRPFTVIIRLAFLALAIVAIVVQDAFGAAALGVGALVGIGAGLGLARLSVRSLAFEKRGGELSYRVPRVLSAIPLAAIILHYVASRGQSGIFPSPQAHPLWGDPLTLLVDMAFLAYWTYLYLTDWCVGIGSSCRVPLPRIPKTR